MNEKTKALVAETIERMNEERESEARNKLKSYIGAIQANQDLIKSATASIADLRKKIAEITIEPVTEADVLGE